MERVGVFVPAVRNLIQIQMDLAVAWLCVQFLSDEKFGLVTRFKRLSFCKNAEWNRENTPRW
jgi:hypothetical protein